MKTINFKLSKILNDLWLLDNIETEWKIQLLPTKEWNKWNKWRKVKNWNWKWKIYKTLTLEETIKFISNNVNNKWRIYCNLELQKELWDTFSVLEIFDIKKAEVMLEYLLDNNLLWK